MMKAFEGLGKGYTPTGGRVGTVRSLGQLLGGDLLTSGYAEALVEASRFLYGPSYPVATATSTAVGLGLASLAFAA